MLLFNYLFKEVNKLSLVDMINTRVEKKVSVLDKDLNKYPKTLKEGIAFTYYALEQIYKQYGDFETGIVDSGYREEKNDFGIDALYLTGNREFIEDVDQLEDFNEDSRFEFHIFQFKKGNSIDVETLLKLKEGIEKVFINVDFLKDDNEYMYERMKNMKSIRTQLFERFSYKQIRTSIYLCFSGLESTVWDDTNLISRIKDIERLLKSNGYHNVEIKVVDSQELIDLERGKKDITEIIKIENSFKYITSGEEKKKLNGYIAMINASQIANLVGKWQTALFEANIRDYYKNNTNNEKIIETASSDEEAKYFWSFNNGLTITCREVEELPEGRLKLKGLQIVNGCQTSNSLYKAHKNLERLKELESKFESITPKEREEYEELKNFTLNENTHLLLKIIETEDEDLVYRITETTNSQTAISAFSIRANDDIHKNIEMFMKDYGLFYERRVNYYKNLGKSSKEIVDIKKLSQTFISMVKFKPSQAMANPKSSFINNYEKIFPNIEKNQVDYEIYTIPVIVQLQLEQKIKQLQRSKAEKDEIKQKLMSYGKFHLGCFILYSLLGEDYNEKGIKANFKELITNIQNQDEFERHFTNALNYLKEVVIDFTNNKDEVYSVLKKSDVDISIVRKIKASSKRREVITVKHK